MDHVFEIKHHQYYFSYQYNVISCFASGSSLTFFYFYRGNMHCTPMVAKCIISYLTGSFCEKTLVFYGAVEKHFFKVWPASHSSAQLYY